MDRKRPWIVAGTTAALALAGLGAGIAAASDDAPQRDVPGQVELTGVDADSANSPAASANSPSGNSANSPSGNSANSPSGNSANSPAGKPSGNSANSPSGNSANSPAGKVAGVVQDDDDDGGGSADSPGAAQPAAPVQTHVPVTG